MKIKIQIKSVLGKVLFELEKENNTIKETLETLTLKTLTFTTLTLETQKIKKLLFYLFFVNGVMGLKEI